MIFKRQIVIICLLTFLFVPFSKSIETKAEPITLTTGVIYLCATLALSTGVIITTPEMFEDVGKTVYEGVKNIPNVFTQVGDRIKMNVTKDLISLALGICKELPTVSKYFDKILSSEDLGTVITSGGKYLTEPNTRGVITFELSTKGSLEHPLLVIFGGMTSYLRLSDGVHTFYYDNVSDIRRLYFALEPLAGNFSNASSLYKNSTTGYPVNLGYQSNQSGRMEILNVSTTESVCIPYSPDIIKDIDDEKPKVTFPQGSGSISAPLNPTLPTNPSIDKPYTKPSDVPDISVDTDIDTGVGDITKPDTGVGDVPSTGEGLWDTLFGWLSSLFAPLINLLSGIWDLLKSILDFLLGFLTALLTGIKDLLIELFVPAEGFFVDTFNNWNNQFKGKFGVDFGLYNDLKSLSGQGVKDIEFTIMGVPCTLPISFINQFAYYSRMIVTGLVAIYLVWYHYKNLYKLIRGHDPVIGDTMQNPSIHNPSII